VSNKKYEIVSHITKLFVRIENCSQRIKCKQTKYRKTRSHCH